ncbi:hypothetical protein K439DRAFT_1288258, partial [Ramaria rubella]
LIQLRTGHIPLNRHLHGIGKAASPKCPHCPLKDETVHHFIMICPVYHTHRQELEIKIGRGAKHLRNVLLNPKATPKLLQYVSATNRLDRNLG